MTDKECIEAIKSNYPPANYSMLREALDRSMELLENADKYRWHNLRENPNDLPPNTKEICEVAFESIGDKISYDLMHCFVLREDLSIPHTEIYLGWRLHEPFEVEE